MIFCGAYIVKYATVASLSPGLSEANFEAAPSVLMAPPAPLSSGTVQGIVISGLTSGAVKG